MTERFVVITVDSDQQQAFTDCVSAADCESAMGLVLDRRDYCAHGAAFTADDLRGLADECETSNTLDPNPTTGRNSERKLHRLWASSRRFRAKHTPRLRITVDRMI